MKKIHKKITILITVILILGLGGYILSLSNTKMAEIDIKEASVRMKVPKSLNDLYYVPPTATPNAYYFSTKKITDMDGQCSAEAVSMGAMYVFSSKAVADQYIQDAGKFSDGKVTTKTTLKEMDGKFYVFDGGSNQYCSSNQDVKDLQKKQSEAFIEAGKNIQKTVILTFKHPEQIFTVAGFSQAFS